MEPICVKNIYRQYDPEIGGVAHAMQSFARTYREDIFRLDFKEGYSETVREPLFVIAAKLFKIKNRCERHISNLKNRNVKKIDKDQIDLHTARLSALSLLLDTVTAMWDYGESLLVKVINNHAEAVFKTFRGCPCITVRSDDHGIARLAPLDFTGVVGPDTDSDEDETPRVLRAPITLVV